MPRSLYPSDFDIITRATLVDQHDANAPVHLKDMAAALRELPKRAHQHVIRWPNGIWILVSETEAKKGKNWGKALVKAYCNVVDQRQPGAGNL